MTEADIPHLLAIENASFPDDPYTADTFKHFMTRGSGLVADVGGTPAAYMLHRDDDETPGFRYGQSLAVHPDHRRAGLGEALMRRLVDVYPQASADVDVTNTASKGLLKKLGFKSVRTFKEGNRTAHRMHYSRSEKSAALTSAKLNAAAKETAEPTDEQKESGRYKKGRVSWKGLVLAIETPKGGVRSGTAPDGTKWQTTMKDHYGYVEGTTSEADGDAVDFFLSDAHLDSEVVFVINQKKKDGTFDEHKCVLGCISKDEAKKTYLRNYSAGWTGMGEVTPITIEHFKWWMEHADTSKEVKNGFFAAPHNLKRREKKAADPITGEEVPLPYRDRAEMYAMKDGKLFGGLFDHGGFGVYGGGIDPGEDAPTAAGREFQEETGWTVSNPRPLPFDPHTLDWKPPFSNPKLAERAKQFKGSRTHYFIGDLGDQIPDAKIDELGRKDVRLYDLDEALGLADQQGLDPDLQAANKKRVEILKHLKTLSVPQPEKQAEDDHPDDEEELKKLLAKKSYLGRYKCPHCGGTNMFNGIPGTGTTFRGSGHCQDCDKGCSIVGLKLKRIGDGPEIVTTDDQIKSWKENRKWERRARREAGEKKANSVFEDYDPVMWFVKRGADEHDHPFTIAVDLDGTLAVQEKPFNVESVGEPITKAVKWVRRFHAAGARIIIFTVRGSVELVKEWLEEHEVPFDYINENPDQPPNSSGKVFADAYWDDRGWNAIDPDEHGPELLRRAKEHSKDEPLPVTGSTLLDGMEDADERNDGAGEDAGAVAAR